MMENRLVNRYDIERIDYDDFGMVIYEDGAYVTFEDYQAELGCLQDDLDTLQRKYDNLADKIAKLYWEI